MAIAIIFAAGMLAVATGVSSAETDDTSEETEYGTLTDDEVTTDTALIAALEAGGEVTLGADIDMAGTSGFLITIASGISSTLDLNGYTVTAQVFGAHGSAGLILVSSGGSLTVTNSDSEDKGGLTGGKDTVRVEGGTFILRGGTITTDESRAYYPLYATGDYRVEVHGGTITGFGKWPLTSDRYTVLMEGDADSGEFVMDGGKIVASKTSDENIGKVVRFSGRSMTFSGGEISATGDSTYALYITSGTALIDGGKISSSQASSSSTALHAVYVTSGVELTVSGGELNGYSYGLVVGGANVRIEGGTLSNVNVRSGSDSSATEIVGGSIHLLNCTGGTTKVSGDAVIDGGILAANSTTVIEITGGTISGTYPGRDTVISFTNMPGSTLRLGGDANIPDNGVQVTTIANIELIGQLSKTVNLSVDLSLLESGTYELLTSEYATASFSNLVYVGTDSVGTYLDGDTIYLAKTYAVSFDLGQAPGSVSSQTVCHGRTATEPTAPSWSGHTFLGWFTGDSERFDFDTAITEDTTLTAQWGDTPVTTYTIYYDANGGTGTMADTTASVDVSIALRSNAFTRTGYTFLGWATSASATEATHSNGQSVTNLASAGGTVTLYAVWEAKAQYTVSFDLNGGSGSFVIQTVYSGDTAVRPSNPVREGYSFAGWYLNGSLYDFSTPVMSDIVLVAQWKTGGGSTGYVSTLSYDANGGYNAPDAQVFKSTSGMDHAFTVTSAVPERSGYSFQGWAMSAGGSVAYRAGDSVTVPYNGSLTLYAVWAEGYRVAIDTGGADDHAPILVTPGDTITLPYVERDGYTFDGWYLGSTYVGAIGDQYTVSGNGTLTAHWRSDGVSETAWEWIILAVAIIAAILIILFAVIRRRNEDQSRS